MMNTRPMERRKGFGFTLIELLAVITIIVILAGLTVGGMKFFSRRQAEDKTRVQLKLLANACEEFKYDYGVYPPLPSAEGKEEFTSTDGANETEDLWEALFGDTDNDKSDYEKDDDQSAYLGELDPKASAQGWLQLTGVRYKIMDPFGNEFRYRKVEDPSSMRNPDIDLWSMGADGLTDPENRESEDCLDDIWD